VALGLICVVETAAGYRLVKFTPKGSKSADAAMGPSTTPPQVHQYRVLHVQLLSNLQKDMNKAALDGHRYCPHTLAQFGGAVVAISEKPSIPKTRYEYRMHAALQVSNAHEEAKNSPGLERRWIVYYAVGELLRMVYRDKEVELDVDLRKLSKSNTWQDIPTHPVKATLAELFKLAGTALNKAYNQAAKQPDFRHRNWFRHPDTLNDIKTELDVIPEYRGLGNLGLFDARKT
jgi:hypothetical protein